MVVVAVLMVVAAVAVDAGPVAAVAIATTGAVDAVIVARSPAAAPGAQCVLPPGVTHSVTLFIGRSRSAGALLLRVPRLQFD